MTTLKSVFIKNLQKFTAVTLITCLAALEVRAQYFGFNKPKYRKFDFRVLESPHFKLHHYFDNDSVASSIIKLSEKWYDHLSEVLRDTFDTPNPLIFYKHHADFQQTGVIDALIGVGTAGFAEGIKNRIVMPMLETNAQTSHVLGHEIVHAFQFHLLRTEESTSLSNMRNMPLWFIEGMAEYLSIGKEDAHTAMWMRDAVMHDDIPTLRDMTMSMRYFPYRFGHAFWAFFAGMWGEDKIRDLFILASIHGYDKALELLTGFNQDQISNMWRNKLREDYLPLLEHTTAPFGKFLFEREATEGMTFAPVISHNGEYMVFASEKDLLSIELYLANAKTGEIIRKISSGVHQSHIDDFNFIDAVGAFSPDNRLFAFPVFSRGRSILLVVNTNTGRVEREIDVPGLETFNSIDWSPDGRFMVFSAITSDGEYGNLMLYDYRRNRTEQLTRGPFSDIQPAWSPDGRTIAFASNRGQDIDFPNFEFGTFRICLMDIFTRRVDVLDLFPGVDNMNPKFSPDGHQLYFLSEADGFRNLYRYSMVSGSVAQITRFFTGISGITKFSPALSVAWQTGEVIFSVFDRKRYKIFAYEEMELDWHARLVDPQFIDKRAATLPPIRQFTPEVRERRVRLRPISERILERGFDSLQYQPRFRLTNISASSMGLGTNHLGSAMSGGINLMFTDMLNDHQIITGAQISGTIADFAGYAAYLNRKRPLHWGVSLSHMPFVTSFAVRNLERIAVNDTLSVIALNAATVVQRTFQQQLALFSHLPFSKHLRLEGNVNISRFSFNRTINNNFFVNGNLVEQSSGRIPAPDDLYAGQVSLALVNDRSFFGLLSPLRGQRYRLQIEQNFGPTQLTGILADYRKYHHFRPFSLGFRGFYYGRYGRDADALNPLIVGNDFFVRGYNINSFLSRPCLSPDCVSPNQLVGTHMAVWNTELRLPFSGPPRLSVIPSRMLFSDLVLFADAGLAWNDFDTIDLRWGPQPGRRSPVVSTGVAFRLNLLGFAILEPYFAVPFQRFTRPTGVFGLFISAGGF